MPTSTTGMGTFSEVLNVTSLSASYSDTQVALNTHGSNDAALYITFVKGSETSVDIQVEVWDAENGWFVVPYVTEGSGAATAVMALRLTADGNRRWGIRRLGRFETQIRVSAKANTTTTDTSLLVELQLGQSRYPIAGNVV